MTRALLDINVLVALLDSGHIHHRRACDWLESEITHGWASCAITQNGFVRLTSQPRHPIPVPPGQAIAMLANAAGTRSHDCWPCSLSILDAATFDTSRIHVPRQVTDAYLLALASANGGRFVTFDRTVPIAAVRVATSANLVIL